LALDNLKRDPLSLVQTPVSLTQDGRVVYENISLAGVALDESIPLFCIEPLDGALLFACYGKFPPLASLNW